MKHVLDYVVTHDQPGRRLVVATGCGRAELALPWVIKRQPDLRDAIHWVMWLHCRLCNAVGLQPWDTEVGTIAFNGEVVPPAPPRSGGNEQLARAPGPQSQTDRPQILPTASEFSELPEPWP